MIHRSYLLNHPSGFTLLDVMVGILLSLLFTGVAMQSIVMSTYLRSKSQGDSEASVWIQEDIERIKYEASRLDYVSGYQPDLATCQNKSYAKRFETEVKKISFQPSRLGAGGKTYQIARTFSTPNNSIPEFSNILRVDYVVTDDQAKVVAESYTEVVPEASLDCPVF
jgi:hypothetical protein